MARTPRDSPRRTPRRAATYRGQSRCYYGFSEFQIDDALPHAAGVYMLANACVGPERWRVILIGDTADFADAIPRDGATREAKRRGATRILLHFSPLTAVLRRQAARDLWAAIRAPLVAWDSETAALGAQTAKRA